MTMRKLCNKKYFNAVLYGTAFVFLQASCGGNHKADATSTAVEYYRIPSSSVSIKNSSVDYRIGGYGSDLVYFGKDHTFWLLTDRGPNVDNQSGDGKIFPQPDYCPRVGVFELKDGGFALKREILLKDTNNVPFTGLPMEKGPGLTGEIAYATDGKEIYLPGAHGIDPEGLAVCPDRTFWVSDEYGPFLMHFDQTGRCMEVLSPFDGSMPRHYRERKPNRGLEGLCANPDGTRLYGIMQSPLVGRQEHRVPLFKYDTVHKKWSEYVYPLDAASSGANALCWVNDSTLLVLERDGKFPDKKHRVNKKIYQVCLTDSARPLKKTLFLDIVKRAPGYIHDKVEGMALIGDSVLCIVNDDDFGITSPRKPDNTIVEKDTPSGERDFNEICFFRMK